MSDSYMLGSDVIDLAAEEAPPKKFRVTAKTIWITWSQFNRGVGHLDGVIGMRDHIVNTWHPAKYIIGEETHEDGGKHYHAVLYFANKVNIKNCHHFDIQIDGFNNHPSFESAGDANTVHNRVEYCKKEGHYISNWDDLCLEAIQLGIRSHPPCCSQYWFACYDMNCEPQYIFTCDDCNWTGQAMHVPDACPRLVAQIKQYHPY